VEWIDGMRDFTVILAYQYTFFYETLQDFMLDRAP
jgi:hypothetical protein